MNNLTSVLVRCFQWLVRLYPPAFRTAFGAEMAHVFAKSLVDTERQGRLALLALMGRELRDLPVNLLREHWRARSTPEPSVPQSLETSTSVQPEGRSPSQQGWGAALLAGLPHGLLALGIGLSSTLATARLPLGSQRWVPVFTAILAVGLLTALLVVFLKARRDGWPLWSASWYFYGLIPIITLPLAFLQQWNWPLGRAVRLDEAYLYVILPLVLGFLLYRLIRRDRLMALLAVLPLVAVLWMPVLEFVPVTIRTGLTVATWLLVGLTAVGSVRLGDAAAATWLALGLNLLIGVPYAYAQTYLKVLPAEALGAMPDGPTVLDWVDTLVPHYLGTATLILGPLLIWRLREVGQRVNGVGRRAYRWAASGFTLMVVGNLAAFWWMMRSWTGSDYRVFQLVVYGGLLLYLIGSGLLLASAIRRRQLSAAAPSVLLVLVLLCLPVVLMLPLLLGMRSMPRGMPFAFLHIHDARLAVYGLGLAWLVLAAWVATRTSGSRASGSRPRRATWLAAVAGVLPFAMFGLQAVLQELRIAPYQAPLMLGYGVLLAGIAVAWFRDFPLWSYPYVGILPTFTWAQMWSLNRWVWARVEGTGWVQARQEPPKWLIWVLLLLFLGGLLLATRSARPLRRFLRSIRQDWTLLSFALYGVMAWYLPAITDENHSPYLVAGLVIVTVSLSWGALGYMVQRERLQRMLALGAGLTIGWLATDVINASYWIGRSEPWMTEPVNGEPMAIRMVLGWVILMALFMAPALPGLLRRSIDARRAS